MPPLQDNCYMRAAIFQQKLALQAKRGKKIKVPCYTAAGALARQRYTWRNSGTRVAQASMKRGDLEICCGLALAATISPSHSPSGVSGEEGGGSECQPPHRRPLLAPWPPWTMPPRTRRHPPVPHSPATRGTPRVAGRHNSAASCPMPLGPLCLRPLRPWLLLRPLLPLGDRRG